MGRMRIVVNFKNTPEKIALFEELNKHSSPGSYIKDVFKGIENKDKAVSKIKNNQIKSDELSEIMNL
jgi:hypothetical protein